MPGHYQWSVDRLDEEIEAVTALKIPAVILFGIPDRKGCARFNCFPNGRRHSTGYSTYQGCKFLSLLIADVCFCEYTNHGHCDVVVYQNSRGHYDVNNDQTNELFN